MRFWLLFQLHTVPPASCNFCSPVNWQSSLSVCQVAQGSEAQAWQMLGALFCVGGGHQLGQRLLIQHPHIEPLLQSKFLWLGYGQRNPKWLPFLWAAAVGSSLRPTSFIGSTLACRARTCHMTGSGLKDCKPALGSMLSAAKVFQAQTHAQSVPRQTHTKHLGMGICAWRGSRNESRGAIRMDV